MADFQDLISRLKSASESHEAQSAGYHQPTVSSPLFSPSPMGPQPHHSSAILSPNTSALNTPVPEQPSTTRAPDLLSLLRFKQGAGSATASPNTSSQTLPASAARPIPQARPISETDPIGSFVRKTSSFGSIASPSLATTSASRPELRGEASSSSANPQDFLLKLLNQAGPSTAGMRPPSITQPEAPPASSDVPLQSTELEVPEAVIDDLAQDIADAKADDIELSPQASREVERKSSPIRVFGEPSAEPSAFEPPSVQQKSVFTYVNPFEQLSASSPRNRTPVSKEATSGPPSKARKPSPIPAESTTSAKRTPTPPSVFANKTETVSEKVGEVGESVDKEVKQVLAEMTAKANGDSLPKAVEEVQEAAQEIKEEFGEDGRQEAMEAGMPKPMAEAFVATIETAAECKQPPSPDDWEAQSSLKVKESIRVYNFPMRPFISIDIKKFEDQPAKIMSTVVTEIARIKKDFDQIDRNLVTATQSHIVYPLKNGGFRIILQDNGQHKQVFSGQPERIFNVQIGRSMKYANSSGPPGREIETLLGTGVDGTVFWTSLANFPKEQLYGNDWEGRGFIFPARQEQENTSGGQLKTRVKCSTRNPEYFAYGRGKYIYLIWPQIARSAAYTGEDDRICNSDKYFKDHALKIATGKAAKDFSFSADDTVIASLDKAGKLKFWDIRKLTDASNYDTDPEPHASVEVREPILQHLTASPNEKCWPTSVMFLDKERPMNKGIALRYVLVGLKQNHTLQLWDLSLGKPVQEINFPHEQESDGICSLAYHPRSGILAVGHPTRNSIYLLHVSAPKYNLAPMSQAKYLTMLANKDKNLPQPDSTIIISGCREYTLGTRGQLRSLDMLSDPIAAPSDGSVPLFELYLMHSRGITNVVITRTMLGWSNEGKINNPVDAQKVGAIEVNQLNPPPAAPPSAAASTNGDAATARDAKPVREVPVREQAARGGKAPTVAEVAAAAVNGSNDKPEKSEKKKKKKAAAAAAAEASSSAVSAPAAASPAPSPARKSVESPASTPAWAAQLLAKSGPSNGDAMKDAIKNIESSMNTEFSNLYRRLQEDRRIQDASSAAKQETVLRLVSTSLSESVEPVFGRIVNEQLTSMMVGPLKDIVVQTIDRNLSNAFAHSMKTTVPKEIEKALPVAMAQVTQQPGVMRAVADQLGATIARHVDGFINTLLQEKLMPAYTQLAVNAAQTAVGQVERQMNEQLRLHEVQRQHDAVKIDHLLKSVGTLQEVISAMAEEQAKFQAEILNLSRQPASPEKAVTSPRSSGSTTAARHHQRPAPQPKPKPKTPEEIEREGIQDLLTQHQYEQAAMQWLQSTRQAALFDEIFVHIDPSLMSNMSPLVVLSICAAITFDFTNNTEKRLEWLDTALNLAEPRDREFAEIFPRIMDIITTRLHKAYMELSLLDLHNPALRKMSSIARRTNDLKAMTSGGATAGAGPAGY